MRTSIFFSSERLVRTPRNSSPARVSSSEMDAGAASPSLSAHGVTWRGWFGKVPVDGGGEQSQQEFEIGVPWRIRTGNWVAVGYTLPEARSIGACAPRMRAAACRWTHERGSDVICGRQQAGNALHVSVGSEEARAPLRSWKARIISLSVDCACFVRLCAWHARISTTSFNSK